jgi:hypothetical protein
MSFAIEWKLLNVITLGHTETDNINQMIATTFTFRVIFIEWDL